MKKKAQATKKKETDDPLEKLLKLTKLLKRDNVRVTPQEPPRAANKWRNKDPKFSPKPQAASNLVEAGGMQVDPSLKEAYDLWRQDKLAEQAERRAMGLRRLEAKRAARKALYGSGAEEPRPEPEGQ